MLTTETLSLSGARFSTPTGVNTSLRRFFALSAAIALNIRLRVCLTVATPFDRMACKVKSWLPHIKLIQNFLQSLEPPFRNLEVFVVQLIPIKFRSSLRHDERAELV